MQSCGLSPVRRHVQHPQLRCRPANHTLLLLRASAGSAPAGRPAGSLRADPFHQRPRSSGRIGAIRDNRNTTAHALKRPRHSGAYGRAICCRGWFSKDRDTLLGPHVRNLGQTIVITFFAALCTSQRSRECLEVYPVTAMGGRKLALRQLCQVARTQLRCFSTAQPALAGFEGRDGEPMPAIKAPEGPNGVIHVGSLQSLHWPPIAQSLHWPAIPWLAVTYLLKTL